MTHRPRHRLLMIASTALALDLLADRWRQRARQRAAEQIVRECLMAMGETYRAALARTHDTTTTTGDA